MLKMRLRHPQSAILLAGLLLLGLSGPTVADCASVKDAATTTTIRTEETGTTLTYFGANSVRAYRGIESASLDGFTLRVRMGARLQYAESSAPGIKRIEVTHYEARPGSTVIGNVVLLGLPLLFNPRHTINRLAGCDEERVLGVVADETRKQLTGRVEWRTDGKAQKIQLVIEGLAIPVVLEQNASDQDILTINLKDAVMASEKLPAALIVACASCTPDEPGAAAFPALKLVQPVPVDFSVIKQEELAAIQQREKQAAQELADAKAAEARAAAELRTRVAREREAKERFAAQQRLVREKAEQEALELRRRKAAREQLQNL